MIVAVRRSVQRTRYGSSKLIGAAIRAAEGPVHASAIAHQLSDDDSVVVLLVAGGVHDRYRPLLRAGAQLVDLVRTVGKLGAVTTAELVKPLRNMVKPLAQHIAGRQLARPLVQPRAFSGDAAGPDVVDQHPVAVTGFGLVVDPLRAHVESHLSLRGRRQCGSRTGARWSAGSSSPSWLAEVQVAVRRAEVADHRGVLGLQALERLAGTGAQVNDGVLVGDVDDPPVGTEEQPALETVEGQGFGRQRCSNQSDVAGGSSRRAGSSALGSISGVGHVPPAGAAVRVVHAL